MDLLCGIANFLVREILSDTGRLSLQHTYLARSNFPPCACAEVNEEFGSDAAGNIRCVTRLISTRTWITCTSIRLSRDRRASWLNGRIQRFIVWLNRVCSLRVGQRATAPGWCIPASVAAQCLTVIPPYVTCAQDGIFMKCCNLRECRRRFFPDV